MYSTAFAHTCCKSSIYMLLYKLSQTPKASTLHMHSSVFTFQMCYLINHLSVYASFQNRIQFLETNTKKKSLLSEFLSYLLQLSAPHGNICCLPKTGSRIWKYQNTAMQIYYVISFSSSPTPSSDVTSCFILFERNERKFLLPLEKECHQQEATTAQPQKPPSAVG